MASQQVPIKFLFSNAIAYDTERMKNTSNVLVVHRSVHAHFADLASAAMATSPISLATDRSLPFGEEAADIPPPRILFHAQYMRSHSARRVTEGKS